MKTVSRGCLAVVAAVAVSMLLLNVPARVDAETKITIYPGMEILQGPTVCKVSFVETRLRLAITTNRCNGVSEVSDRRHNVVGTVIRASHDVADFSAAGSSMLAVEYEVIALADGVSPSDLLPTGRRLVSRPVLDVRPGQAVCYIPDGAGEVCGSIGSIGNGRFVVDKAGVDKRDIGAPLYSLTGGDQAVILGLVESIRGGALAAESWHAVMQQVVTDARVSGVRQPVHLISHRVNRKSGR
jgi:hypothetical protein